MRKRSDIVYTNAIFFSLLSLFLFSLFELNYVTIPRITYLKESEWTPPSYDYLELVYRKHGEHCSTKYKQLYDDLRHQVAEAENVKFHTKSPGIPMNSDFEIYLPFLFTYVLIVLWWLSDRRSFPWWGMALVVVANLVVGFGSRYIVNLFSQVFQDNSRLYKYYSYSEYDRFFVDELKVKPFDFNDFDNFEDYIVAEHDRSYNLLYARVQQYQKLKEYYDNRLYTKNTYIFCLLAIAPLSLR